LLSFDAGRLAFGGFDFHGASEPEGDALRFIDAGDVASDDLVVDLRSLDEAPVSPLATALRFTPEHIDAFIDAHPPADRRVVVCCHSGVRAWRVGRQLRSRGYANLALATLAGISA
jgi:rhodanese-related sulfurtransferase